MEVIELFLFNSKGILYIKSLNNVTLMNNTISNSIASFGGYR